MGIEQPEAELPEVLQRCHFADVYQPLNADQSTIQPEPIHRSGLPQPSVVSHY
jgi:hypothetical protein